MVASGASTYSYSSGSAVVSPTVNTSYNVTGTSAQGCVSSNTAVSSVTVNTLPTITTITNNTLICVGNTATLTATGATTYTWNPGGFSGNSVVVTPTATTIYTVTGTNSNGCNNVSTITQSVSACTSINNLLLNSADIVIYPNPALNHIIIKSEIKLGVITITNLLGSVVYKEHIKENETTIDVSKLTTGVYFVRVGDTITKVIKE